MHKNNHKNPFNFKEQAKNLVKIQNIAIMGLFIAMYIVLYQFNIKITSFIEIRVGYFVLAAAAMYGGPLFGMTAGVLSDILSMILTGGQGASFFFGFTVSYALLGFLFGFVFYQDYVTPFKAFQGAIVEFLVSIFLNTYWLHVMYGSTYKALFIARLPKSCIMLIVSSILFYVFLASLNRVMNRANISFNQGR